jgi:hypothetical protein
MDFLMKQIFGSEVAESTEVRQQPEVPDAITLLVQKQALDHGVGAHESFHTTIANWLPPDGNTQTFAKRAGDSRATLACGTVKGKGARIERSVNGWVREYDAAGNLICGYVEE